MIALSMALHHSRDLEEEDHSRMAEEVEEH